MKKLFTVLLIGLLALTCVVYGNSQTNEAVGKMITENESQGDE